MIEWFDRPYVGTSNDGFEILIHGFVLNAEGPAVFGLYAIIVTDDGGLRMVPHSEVKMDWRWTRDKGWFGTDEQMAAEANT